MNTQLKNRPTPDTVSDRHVSRPQPIWTGPETPVGDPTPDHKRVWAIIAAVAVLATAMAAGVALLGDGSTDAPTPAVSTERPAFDSPGGNTLTIPPIPPIAQSPAANTTAQRPAFDSPGGNSLNTSPRSTSTAPFGTTEAS